MTSFLQNFDLKVLEFINNNLHNPILDKLMITFTFLGNAGFIWILLSVILIITKTYRKAGIMVLCVLVLNVIIADGFLKNIIQRPRPFNAVPAVKLLISKPITYSFPSGHTSSAFAAAGILASKVKKYRIYAILLAILIAFSRMYLFVHYPTDILGGIIIGLISARIVIVLFNLISKSPAS